MKKFILIHLFFLICLSSIYSDELPSGFWGFNFGMTIDEALKNAENNGFIIIDRDDHRPWMDPEPEGFYYWDIIPPFPYLSKDGNAISVFGGYTEIIFADDAKDRRLKVIFGDNKLFEIKRIFTLPSTYSPLTMVNELITKYGDPENNYINIRKPPSGLTVKDYGYLWNNTKVAMEITFSSKDVFGKGDFKWEQRVYMNYIDLAITKYLSNKILEFKNRMEQEKLEKFKPKL